MGNTEIKFTVKKIHPPKEKHNSRFIMENSTINSHMIVKDSLVFLNHSRCTSIRL